jgi:hypothetical protein
MFGSHFRQRLSLSSTLIDWLVGIVLITEVEIMVVNKVILNTTSTVKETMPKENPDLIGYGISP